MLRAICLTLSGVILASCLGCAGPRLTRPQYDAVYIGQPDYAVEQRLGTPDEVRDGLWVYRNDDPFFYMAVIRFVDGKVADKDWYNDPPPALGDDGE